MERRRRASKEKPLHKQVEETAKRTISPRKIDIDQLIPTGITLLNCCMSDNAFGGWQKGKISSIHGPSRSGKSIIAMSTFAACSYNSKFDNYDLINDDIEQAMEFDTSYLFGDETQKRVIAPKYDKNNIPVYSNTIEDLEGGIIGRCEKGKCKPFIWIVDSLDALTSTEEIEREYKNALKLAKSAEQVTELKKAFGGEKAKIIGRILRQTVGYLKKTGSALILIQQERQKIGATQFEQRWTTSGGNAPEFYSTHRMRIAKGKKITNGDFQIGNDVRVEVYKNKLTGKKRNCEFSIYEDLGVDDVASCIRYLCGEYWKPAVGKQRIFDAPEIDFQGTQRDIIKHIEDNVLEKKMQQAVHTAWNQQEEDLRLGRQRRF